MGDRRQEKGDGRQEKGDGRHEKGDRRLEKRDGRGFYAVLWSRSRPLWLEPEPEP